MFLIYIITVLRIHLGDIKLEGSWGRMGTCVCMAESLCSPLETVTPLLTSYTPVQNKSLILGHMDQPDLVLAGTKIRGRRVFGINCEKEGKWIAAWGFMQCLLDWSNGEILNWKKGPLILLSGRWGQHGGVGGEALALHRDRCLNGFCRWFYASSWWALWQIFPLALLAQSGLRWHCVSHVQWPYQYLSSSH